jgi:C-terminal processing protease CtpA/Prc
VLYLDYDRQRVILEKGDDFGRPFSVPKSGLQFMYNADDEVEVRFVSPGTPADDAGLKQGDIIKTINGIDVQYFDGIIALRKLMRAEVGTTYEMGIVREGKMVTKQITLRDIL